VNELTLGPENVIGCWVGLLGTVELTSRPLNCQHILDDSGPTYLPWHELLTLVSENPVRKFEGLLHFMGEGLLKYVSFKMKVYPRNCLSYIISIFQYENAYCEFLPNPNEQT
jgi:hypothetical protein